MEEYKKEIKPAEAKKQEKPADPTPLGNIATGIVLLTLWPVLFGLTDSTGMVAVLPWALAAAPFIILTTVLAFRAGNVVGAVANGILSGLTLVQNAFWGLAALAYTAAGVSVPEAVSSVKGYMDGTAFLAAAFMLVCIAFIFYREHKYSMAVSMLVICVGFCCMGLSDVGAASLRVPAGVCIVCFAAWMVYSGCAMLIHTALGKKILPY